MNFKDYVIDNIVTLTQLERSVVEGAIETPPDEKMGDLAFPCFPLAKVMRKAPPMIAAELAHKFSDDEKAALNEKVDALKEALKGEDMNLIKSRQEELTAKFYEVSEKLYKAAQEAAQAQGGDAAGADGYTEANYTDIDE